MKKINDLLREYSIKPLRYTKVGKAVIIDTDDKRFVIKERFNKDLKIYNYLASRNFNYYPHIINSSSDDYQIMEYIDQYDIPDEQKIIDLIDLVALLHSKTTHFKETTEDDYKEIYEDISNNIIYLNSYYNDLINIIDTKVYPSPSEYLLARNISKIFASLKYAEHELNEWYEIVKNTNKKRLVVLHNNLDLSHFLRNSNSYLISWEKSKVDIPIFDLYKLYKKVGLDFEFTEILKRYEKNYPLLNEERKLLFILMALPDKVELDNNEYENTKRMGKMIDLVYKTEMIISPYYSKEGETK